MSRLITKEQKDREMGGKFPSTEEMANAFACVASCVKVTVESFQHAFIEVSNKAGCTVEEFIKKFLEDLRKK